MSGDSFLQPIPTEPQPQIRDKVYERLRQAILRGQLEPGTRLVERKLAGQLNVSRTPVREAIRMLELEGLVSYLPRTGVLVAGINEEEVVEIYRIRAVLEGLAARMAAEKIKPGQLEKLKGLLSSMEINACRGNTDQLEDAHREFNDLIFRAAGSPRLYTMIASLVDYIHRCVRVGYSLPGRVAEAAREHRLILEALQGRDGDLAEQTARNHIENSRQACFSRMDPKHDNNNDRL